MNKNIRKIQNKDLFCHRYKFINLILNIKFEYIPYGQLPTVMPTFAQFSFSNEIHPYRISFLREFFASFGTEQDNNKIILRIYCVLPLCTFISFYSNSSRIFYLQNLRFEEYSEFPIAKDFIRKMKGNQIYHPTNRFQIQNKTFLFRWIIALKI